MKYNRLIMFCDYGLDDAIATMHILKNAHMFENIFIVPIGGNVACETAFRNAHTLVSAAHASDRVCIVDARSVPQCAADIPEVHGSDGIGDVLEPASSTARAIDFAALAAEIKSAPDPAHDCVLSLGPCTLPDMLGYVPFCTVLMGGTTAEPPNYGQYEFNEGCDPAAFKRLAYCATAVATLDTCHDKAFAFDMFKLGDPTADKLIGRYLDMCRARGAVCAVYDYVAALAVTNPERFTATRVRRADGVEYNELKLSA